MALIVMLLGTLRYSWVAGNEKYTVYICIHVYREGYVEYVEDNQYLHSDFTIMNI